MLGQYRVDATIPAADMQRARKFYEETLGLGPGEEYDPSNVVYRCGDGTQLFLFETLGHPGGDHTQAGWTVDDIEAVVQDLRSRGVTLLEYSEGPLKTTNGIAEMGGARGCWFKDSEGNTLSLIQLA